MKVLLIDNYDSFTYNLFHYISKFNCKVDVVRNDMINSKDIIIGKFHKTNRLNNKHKPLYKCCSTTIGQLAQNCPRVWRRAS